LPLFCIYPGLGSKIAGQEENAAFSDRASTASTSAVYSPSPADDTERRVRSETELLHAPPIELYPINGFQEFFADNSNEELQFTDTTENWSAIVASGIPPDLAEIIKTNIDTMVTMRVGTHPHHDMPRTSKPLTVHSKTVNHGFLYGYICTDSLLSKINTADREIIPGALDQKDVEHHQNTQLNLTLREIFRTLSNEGDMKIMGVTPEEPPKLILQYKDGKGPKDFHGEFYIDLDKTIPLSEQYTHLKDDPNLSKDTKIKEKIKSYLSSKTPDDPNKEKVRKLLQKFLNNVENGGLDNGIDNIECPIYYAARKLPVSEYNKEPFTMLPLMVLAQDNKPITGDWDIDSESIPIGLPDYAYKPINTMQKRLPENATPRDRAKEALETRKRRELLLSRTKKLFNHYKKELDLILKRLDKLASKQKVLTPTEEKEAIKLREQKDKLFSQGKSIVKLIAEGKTFQDIYFSEDIVKYTGNINPYIFLQNTARNYLYRKAVNNNHACVPMQHGPETDSPFKDNPNVSPSSEGPRMHIYKNHIFYTANESQRVQLCLVKGFLETNSPGMAPWPNFSMEKWHPVIEKQIRLKQKIPTKTKLAYDLYMLLDKLEKNHTTITNKEIKDLEFQIKTYKKEMGNRPSDLLPKDLETKYNTIKLKFMGNNSGGLVNFAENPITFDRQTAQLESGYTASPTAGSPQALLSSSSPHHANASSSSSAVVDTANPLTRPSKRANRKIVFGDNTIIPPQPQRTSPTPSSPQASPTLLNNITTNSTGERRDSLARRISSVGLGLVDADPLNADEDVLSAPKIYDTTAPACNTDLLNRRGSQGKLSIQRPQEQEFSLSGMRKEEDDKSASPSPTTQQQKSRDQKGKNKKF